MRRHTEAEPGKSAGSSLELEWGRGWAEMHTLTVLTHVHSHTHTNTHVLRVLSQGQCQEHMHAPLVVTAANPVTGRHGLSLGRPWRREETAQAVVLSSHKLSSDGFALCTLFWPHPFMCCDFPVWGLWRWEPLRSGPNTSTWPGLLDLQGHCYPRSGHKPRKEFPCGWYFKAIIFALPAL